jgi:hypothetical protein
MWQLSKALALCAAASSKGLFSCPTNVSLARDSKGANAVYGSGKTVAYDAETCTEYIRGTYSLSDLADNVDVFQDVFGFEPGEIRATTRYAEARELYEQLTRGGCPVRRLVGHSLGGSVALALAQSLLQEGVIVETRTFAAPMIAFSSTGSDAKHERYRHAFDVISILDGGARTVNFHWDPHPHHPLGYNLVEDPASWKGRLIQAIVSLRAFILR